MPVEEKTKIFLPKLDHALPGKSTNFHVLIGAWLGELFDGMDASMFALVLVPALSELLKTSNAKEIGPAAALILATFMIGWAAGAIVFGYCADKIGRAKTMTVTILVYALATGLCAFSTSWFDLAFYRFLTGFGIGGEITIGAVLVNECWQGKNRLHAVAFLSSSFGFGYLAAAILNLFLGTISWRLLFLAGVLPAFLTLYIRAKIKEPKEFQLLKDLAKNAPNQQGTAHLQENPLRTVFGKELRAKVLCITALATTAIVGYWAALAWIPSWISQLVGNAAVTERSITAIAMNIGAIAFTLFGGKLVHKFGRQRSLQLAFFLSFLTISSMFGCFHQYGLPVLAMAFLAGGFATLPFTILFIYVPEIFPVQARSTAFGVSVQTGRLVAAAASILGGQLISWFGGSYGAAGLTLSSIYLFGVVACRFMPQTSGELESITILEEAITNKPYALGAGEAERVS
jgi:MFS family permease